MPGLDPASITLQRGWSRVTWREDALALLPGNDEFWKSQCAASGERWSDYPFLFARIKSANRLNR
jgi:hypothetical protein